MSTLDEYIVNINLSEELSDLKKINISNDKLTHHAALLNTKVDKFVDIFRVIFSIILIIVTLNKLALVIVFL